MHCLTAWAHWALQLVQSILRRVPYCLESIEGLVLHSILLCRLSNYSPAIFGHHLQGVGFHGLVETAHLLHLFEGLPILGCVLR